jgi:hypothetical protein
MWLAGIRIDGVDQRVDVARDYVCSRMNAHFPAKMVKNTVKSTVKTVRFSKMV